MIKIKRIIALMNGENLTPQTALEKAVKKLVAKIGSGGGGGALMVTITEIDGELTANVSVADIISAAAAGPVLIKSDGNTALVFEAGEGVVKAACTFVDGGITVTMLVQGSVGSGGSDIWTVEWKESASTGPLVVSASIDIDADTGKQTITLNKTAEELFDAVGSGGRMIKTSVSVPGEGGAIVDVVRLHFVECQKMETGGNVAYDFVYMTGDKTGAKLFYSDAIGSSATVVLTEV